MDQHLLWQVCLLFPNSSLIARRSSNQPAGAKIVYPNGRVDPWHVLGVLADVGADQPWQLMDNTAHCADLYMPRDSDDAQLKAFRAKAISLLHSWLSD